MMDVTVVSTIDIYKKNSICLLSVSTDKDSGREGSILALWGHAAEVVSGKMLSDLLNRIYYL